MAFLRHIVLAASAQLRYRVTALERGVPAPIEADVTRRRGGSQLRSRAGKGLPPRRRGRVRQAPGLEDACRELDQCVLCMNGPEAAQTGQEAEDQVLDDEAPREQDDDRSDLAADDS